MEIQELKDIMTDAGVNYNDLNDIKQKLSLLIFDNGSAFYNDRIDDPLHQIIKIDFDKGFFHFREAYKGELMETYVPFSMLQRISFKSTEKIENIHYINGNK